MYLTLRVLRMDQLVLVWSHRLTKSRPSKSTRGRIIHRLLITTVLVYSGKMLVGLECLQKLSVGALAPIARLRSGVPQVVRIKGEIKRRDKQLVKSKLGNTGRS